MSVMKKTISIISIFFLACFAMNVASAATATQKIVFFKIDNQTGKTVTFSPNADNQCIVSEDQTQIGCVTDIDGKANTGGHFNVWLNPQMSPAMGPILSVMSPSNYAGNFSIQNNGAADVNASLSTTQWSNNQEQVVITIK